MESNGNSRGGLLSAGGILSILTGIFEIIISGVYIMAAFWFPGIIYSRVTMFFITFLPENWWQEIFVWEPLVLDLRNTLITVGIIALVLGVIAIVGGISAMRRKRFGLSLAGAICALPSNILGIMAVIFVVLGRREFKAAG